MKHGGILVLFGESLAILLMAGMPVSALNWRDIEKRCEVYMYDDNHGELECRGVELRFLERGCEVYRDGPEDEYAVLDCNRDLREFERCEVCFWDPEWGELEC